MRLIAKVAYNTFVQTISKTVAAALGLLTVAIITRYLNPSGFGQYTTIMTFLSFFGILADLGLTLVTAQMISRPGIDEKKVLSNLFTLRLVTAFFFLSLAPIVVLFFPYAEAVKLGVAVAAASFLFIALNQVLVGLFQNRLRMDKVSIAEVVGRLALVVGVIGVVRFDWGLLGVMGATVLANGINFLLHYLFSRQFNKIKLEFDFTIWKDILRRAWPFSITIALNLIYLKSDTLILSLVKPQAHVGIYGASYKVVEVLIILPFMFAGLVLPILTKYWVAAAFGHFKRVLQRSFDLMIILAVPLMVGAQFFAEEIMTVVAGAEYADSGPVLQILIGAAGLIFIACMFTHAIIAVERQKETITAYIFTSVTALAGYIIFIPQYSYLAAAWLTVYSELAIMLFSIYYVKKYINFLPNLRILFVSVIASGCMARVILLIPPSFYTNIVGLILSLLGSGLIYFIFIYLFKGITKQDIMEAMNKQ
jgi:O-antigen/teichoic acid export membrane protein